MIKTFPNAKSDASLQAGQRDYMQPGFLGISDFHAKHGCVPAIWGQGI